MSRWRRKAAVRGSLELMEVTLSRALLIAQVAGLASDFPYKTASKPLRERYLGFYKYRPYGGSQLVKKLIIS